MNGRHLDVRGRRVWLFEAGVGKPLLYLHGLADLHGASAGPCEFHNRMSSGARLIAPAHPGCAGSDEDEAIESVEDVVFHYLEVLDALSLDSIALSGSGIGGWIAAEIAVRHPDRIKALALVGPTGLFVPGQPIADLFWESHPVDGWVLAGLRSLLFGDPDLEIALELFPDGRGDIEQELLRYRMFRFASRIGFNPPYLHHRRLRERLYRYDGPVQIVSGALDRLVPRSHAEIYGAELPHAELKVLDDVGHSPHLERPGETASALKQFLSGC